MINVNEQNYPDQIIKNEYSEFIKVKIRTYARSAAILTVVVLPYFIFEDLYINHLPQYSVFFRLLPIFIVIVILIFVFTPLKTRLNIIKNLYHAGEAAYMIMMTGLVAIAVNTPKYEVMVLGLTVVIFCIYVISVHGMKVLIPVYGIPLLGLIVYLYGTKTIPGDKIAILSNPVTTAFICIFLSEIQERLRFNEFHARKIIEIQNNQLQEKNDIIREQNSILKRDIEMARSIQRNLIPLDMPISSGLDLASKYVPMLSVGGDYYDFIIMKEYNKIGIFISDVSGHGVAAALIASMVKAILNTAANKMLQPSSLLGYINEKLIGQTNGNFVTAFYGLYDTDKKTIRFSRAGHDYPFLIRGKDIIELKAEGIFLGIRDNISFEEKEIQLEIGDKILLYTDGLIEATDENGTMFRELLTNGMLINQRSKNPHEYVDSIYENLTSFRNSSAFDDDVCIICMEVK